MSIGFTISHHCYIAFTNEDKDSVVVEMWVIVCCLLEISTKLQSENCLKTGMATSASFLHVVLGLVSWF